MATTDANRRKALKVLTQLVESPDQIVFNQAGQPIGIQLFQCGVTDREMECFRHFAEFESISVGGCLGVTDAGLRHIAHLKTLIYLDLQSTGITDAGLVHLANLTNLRTLDLNLNQITDLGLRHLEGLKQLRSLVINEEAISDEAYTRLMAALPKLSITNF